jgi:hypothetical protein
MIIENKDDIEMYLEVKFGDLKGEKFFHTATYKGCDDESYYMTFDDMIERLAEEVEQHLADEDFDFASEMPEISENLWDKWLAVYDVPEPECPRCGGGRGCNYCLMTGY